jgi:hypothetical protein
MSELKFAIVALACNLIWVYRIHGITLAQTPPILDLIGFIDDFHVRSLPKVTARRLWASTRVRNRFRRVDLGVFRLEMTPEQIRRRIMYLLCRRE